jgi:hypothetical protein
MPKKENKPSHVTRGNVFDDLGFSAEEAAILEMKTQLHLEIMKVVRKQKLTSRQRLMSTAALLCRRRGPAMVHQPVTMGSQLNCALHARLVRKYSATAAIYFHQNTNRRRPRDFAVRSRTATMKSHRLI